MSLQNVSICSSFFSQMQVISKKHTLQTPPVVNKPFSTLISGSFLSCMLSASNKPPFQYATEPAVTAWSGQRLSVFSKCLHSQYESASSKQTFIPRVSSQMLAGTTRQKWTESTDLCGLGTHPRRKTQTQKVGNRRKTSSGSNKIHLLNSIWLQGLPTCSSSLLKSDSCHLITTIISYGATGAGVFTPI